MAKKTFAERQKKRSGKPGLKARQKQNRIKEQVETAKKRADFFQKLEATKEQQNAKEETRTEP